MIFYDETFGDCDWHSGAGGSLVWPNPTWKIGHGHSTVDFSIKHWRLQVHGRFGKIILLTLGFQ